MYAHPDIKKDASASTSVWAAVLVCLFLLGIVFGVRIYVDHERIERRSGEMALTHDRTMTNGTGDAATMAAPRNRSELFAEWRVDALIESSIYLLFAIATVVATRIMVAHQTKLRQMAATQAHLALIVENTDDAIMSKSLDGTILSWNRGAEQLFSYRAEEVIGLSVDLLIPEHQRAEEDRIHEQLKAGIRVDHYETIRITKEGLALNVSITSSPLRDTDGTITGASKIIRDITAQKRAEQAVKEAYTQLEAVNDQLQLQYEELELQSEELLSQSEELQESEERFRQLFDESPDAYLLLLDDGMIADSNKTAELLLNFQKQQLHGMSSVALSPTHQPDGRDSAEVIAELLPAVFVQNIETFEWLCLRPDGSEFWADISLKAIVLQGKQAVLVGLRDISVRKEAKKELEQAHRQTEQFNRVLNSILENMADWVWELDRKGRYTYCSPRVEQSLGYTPAEMLCKSPLCMMPAEDVERLKAIYIEISEFMLPIQNLEFWSIAKDGQRRLFVANGVPITGHDGTLTGYRGVARDITDLRLFESKLRKLSRAVQQSPVSIIITDLAGRIEFVNPKFSEVTGYSDEEAIGETPRILNSGLTPPSTYEEIWAVISAGGTWEGDLLNKSKDNELFWEHALISALCDESGTITNYLAVKEDITEKKYIIDQLSIAREKAESATEAKSSFLATMSHEIRTPMNGVLGMNSMLLETQLTAEQREFAEIVRKSGENLLTIINEILDFSKIEAGKLDLEILDFDLRITLEDTVELLAMRANEAKLELICQIDPAVPTFLRGDPGRIRQIIINLVGNAIKFTRKGEVAIRVSLKSEQGLDSVILFEIQDTGIGIPRDRLSSIFDPFTQADGSTTRKYGGTGLGLAICKQLAELMEGEIGVTSEDGAGSTFWFTICLERQLNQNNEAYKALQQAGKGELVKERILVVDDNATNRVLMKGLLRQWGCRHDVAAHGAEGLEMLREAVEAGDPFRIAILDQEMPDMDGMEMGTRIKADPLLAPTLLVMLTSIGLRGDATILERIGFAGYLHKPVRQSQLYDCLELIIGRDIHNTIEGNDSTPQRIITRHIIAESLHSGVRLLLVEDNIINQKVAQFMLKSLGFRVDVAADGQEAVRALEMIDYNLVLMDCLMPVMNGYEATAAIRSGGSRIRNTAVPIIAMTANATQGDREKCLEAGMNDYMSKPVKKQILAELIEKWLRSDGAGTTDHPVEEAAGLTFFNKDAMFEFMDNDGEFMRSILNESTASLPGELDKLKSAFETNDGAAIRILSHTMKGIAANIYAPALHDVCLRIETAAKANDRETAREIIPELTETISRTIETIKGTYL